jgi:hypothetical protein
MEERAVETREVLIRSQVPAPIVCPRSSTGPEQRDTNAMVGGSNPSEGTKDFWRGPDAKGYRGQNAGSNPAHGKIRAAKPLQSTRLRQVRQIRRGPDA